MVSSSSCAELLRLNFGSGSNTGIKLLPALANTTTAERQCTDVAVTTLALLATTAVSSDNLSFFGTRRIMYSMNGSQFSMPMFSCMPSRAVCTQGCSALAVDLGSYSRALVHPLP
eukprot:scpid98935/ scgid32675/ 